MFPKALTQLCIVPLVRASLRHVSARDRMAVVTALKDIYQAATEDKATAAQDAFAAAWGDQYRAVVRLWRGN